MEKELSLQDIFQLLMSKIVFIIIVCFIGTFSAFGITKFMISPKYESRTSMYIKNTEASNLSGVSYQEILSAQELVNTYLVIIKSDRVCQAVADAVNLGYSSKQISGMLIVNAMNNTEAFEIVVTNTDPQKAYKIAAALEKIGPLEIERVVGVENIKIIDSAKLPTGKASPNTLMNTMLGFLISLAFAVVLIIVVDMVDNKVKDPEDLKNRYDIPVIALIPKDESET